ncbi:MAG: tetratricopeptide repeat protein [Candidatus Abyssobacteria bacterium SURF_17]|uniref:Tetratricopeptide repeat protein n=1 Tax=Candidatus Abyssobacteria bacterium SURF_17 TaxID=2093361 RepID=A0A419EWG2_9BACT|nr:MAG: tetratricopeptide repeat protein [Candidatus Abyssubacteria bacterium SURF_17]
MFGQWKKILVVAIVAFVLYMGCNSQTMLKTESFFRKENPNLAMTPKVCYFLGNIAYMTFRYQLAVSIIDRNLKDFPYAPGATNAEFRRALSYEKLGKYDTAIKYYEEFLFAHPKDNRYESVSNRVAKLKALHQES